jgi:hypothetical protein
MRTTGAVSHRPTSAPAALCSDLRYLPRHTVQEAAEKVEHASDSRWPPSWANLAETFGRRRLVPKGGVSAERLGLTEPFHQFRYAPSAGKLGRGIDICHGVTTHEF